MTETPRQLIPIEFWKANVEKTYVKHFCFCIRQRVPGMVNNRHGMPRCFKKHGESQRRIDIVIHHEQAQRARLGGQFLPGPIGGSGFARRVQAWKTYGELAALAWTVAFALDRSIVKLDQVLDQSQA